MKIKNKILVLFLLIIIFTLFFNLKNTLAVSYDITCKRCSKVFTNTNLPEDILASTWYSQRGDTVHLLGVIYLKNNDTGKYFCVSYYSDRNISNDIHDNTKPFYLSNGNFTCSNAWYFDVAMYDNSKWTFLGNSDTYKMSATTYSVVSSTHDIYTNSNRTDIFFQLAPEKPEQAEIPATTIPALETAEQIPIAIIKTLKIVIPVCLVIFGILLLILLVKSVILRVI